MSLDAKITMVLTIKILIILAIFIWFLIEKPKKNWKKV
jgi:hypothetical protein